MPSKPRQHHADLRPRRRAFDARPNSYRRGYDRRWQRYRAAFLARHLLCEHCGAVANEVDHVEPVVGGQSDPKFWAPTNHQALCKSCHSRKTAREQHRVEVDAEPGGGARGS